MANSNINFSEIIKDQIKNYSKTEIVKNSGKVISVGDGIAQVSGLNDVMYNEIVKFENGTTGIAFNLEATSVGVIVLGEYNNIKEGSIVKRTLKTISVPVGDELLGRIVNPIGEPLDGKGKITSKTYYPIERIAFGVMARKSVNEPMETGIISIDSMFPIGKGQRELIIGDRQTGKTSIALDTIINQKGKNVNCVYVAIGQKNSTISLVHRTLQKHGAMEYTTIVSASASELPSLKYIAPFAGCAIAEYWMENGKDVLIIYDDLSKHAVAYRTLSLLLRRPPGREAFPGDVFYLHSRLLERSARITEQYGGGSITALPIIETQFGDISAYIPTNVISITDGQLFLKANLFNANFRPAIDVGLSVSRVGSNAQRKFMKQISGSLKLELAQYFELQSFAQFGSDLDEETKTILEHGQKIMEFLKQPAFSPYEQVDEAILLFSIKYKYIDSIKISRIHDYKKFIIDYFKKSKIREKILKENQLSAELIAELNNEFKNINHEFNK